MIEEIGTEAVQFPEKEYINGIFRCSSVHSLISPPPYRMSPSAFPFTCTSASPFPSSSPPWSISLSLTLSPSKIPSHIFFICKQRKHEVNCSACFIGYNHDRFMAVLIGNGGMFNTWRRLTDVILKLYPPDAVKDSFWLRLEWTQMALYLQYSVKIYLPLFS